jgi:Ca-activated chloride channel family protein
VRQRTFQPAQTLANWLALLMLLALGIVWPPAEGATPGWAEEHAGSLWLRPSAQAQPLEAVRQSTSMRVQVTGNVARVRVTQTFTNQSDAWVEGLYVFPLPDGCAVDELQMQIGERRIVGDIKEREAAHASYELAKAEGRHASLVDQERPNMFTTAVANIGPGSAVTVEIAYLESVPFRDGRYTLNLPLAITPRYTPGAPLEPAAPLAADAARAVNVLFATTATPERVTAPAQQVAIQIDLAAGFALASVRSLNHPVTISTAGDERHIALAAAEAPADRDFELVWTPVVEPDTQAAAFAERRGEDLYALVMLTPPQIGGAGTQRREVIFIIDTSGSMYGPSIDQARAALHLGIERLTATDRFNVIRFSDSASELFRAPQPASADNRTLAGRFVDGLQAGGGTEMRPALELAFATPAPEDALRQIVFITDGSVGNESELVKMIHDRLGAARLFTVGIGAAPNAYFMREAAAAGRGSYTFIGQREQVQERMEDLFRKLEHPALVDLQLQWPGGATAELAAPLPGDLYSGDPLVVAARLSRVPKGLLTLSGRSGDGVWSRQIPVTIMGEETGMAKLWARERIGELSRSGSFGGGADQHKAEIIQLALAHHLVSDFTSLVAVDQTPARPPEQSVERTQVPTSAPQGSYWAADTSGFARTATLAPVLLLLGLASLGIAAAMRWRWQTAT